MERRFDKEQTNFCFLSNCCSGNAFFIFLTTFSALQNICGKETGPLQISKAIKEKRRKEKIKQILNHRVNGEGFILTSGRIWKAIVLRHFNKVYRGELTVDDLVDILEIRYGVKYAQKRTLVKYPIEETLKYIAKVSNVQLRLPP